MSTSETMWDDDDQLPPLPRFNLEREEVFLKRKSALLEEFLRNDGMEPRAVEDRIQILHDRISIFEKELTSKGKWDSARRYIQHAPTTDFDAVDRAEFMAWIDTQSLPPRPFFALRPSTNIIPYEVATYQSKLISQGSHPNTTHHSKRGVTRSREESPTSSIPNKAKRPRMTETDRSPCLRCKILKKKCDSREECSHCPEKSSDNENDFWKVLGCYRGSFDGLCGVICPPFSRSTTRILPHPDGSTKVVTFVLTQSNVSPSKRRRILNFAHTNADFFSLNHAFWDDVTLRRSLVLAASSLDLIEENHAFGEDLNVLNDYEACWAVLQAAYMHPVYLSPTRYNFFRLIRLGNVLSAVDRSSWDIFLQAKRLLRQSVEIYLLERLCGHIASGEMVGTAPFYTSGDSSEVNSLIRVDIKDDMANFLQAIEVTCAGRGKLTGQSQLACFYALLVFGIVKSILIDAYSIQELYEKENTWKSTDAMAINSVYKALVSAFCWASKSDVILQECRDSPLSHTSNETWGTCSLLRHDQWEERGIKGTKDFLLGLGTTLPSETTYNGFFPQKYGLSKVQTPKTVTPISNGIVSPRDTSSHASPLNSNELQGDSISVVD